ncbi:DUF2029 domain-containing protein [bacterium]|nr:DUF2029 domain-containing protein [bacterium]
MWKLESLLRAMNRLLPPLVGLLGLVVFFAHFRATHCDFDTYWIAGDRVLRGDWAGIYQPERNAYGGFLYPLISVLFFSPFAALGPVGGRLAFYLLLLGAVVLILRFAHSLSRGAHRPLILSLALLLVFRSLIDCFQTGNIGILLIGGVILAFDSGRKQPRVSDLLLGAVAALKPLGVFFLGLRFVLREWGRLLFAVFLGLCPLLYPGSWYHMGLCYLPMLVVLLTRVFEARQLRLVRAESFALLLFFVLYSISGRSVLPRELSLRFEQWSMPTLGALVAFFVYRRGPV